MTDQDGLAARVGAEAGKVIVGREVELRMLLECLLARGHALLEGVPGTSKTLLARVFSQCLGLEFKRVQFTPDMLPLDIVGGFVYNIRDRDFEFKRGPVFTNILLADEINRAPPKVQSALLEAMQELQVTVDGHTEKLPSPLIIIGTENPLEFQGVYPLPEGQLDRFMMKVVFSYQSIETEKAVLRRNLTALDLAEIKQVLSSQDLKSILESVERVKVSGDVLDYMARLGEATRKDERIELGSSTRAMVQLLHCARAKALLDGRGYVMPEDIKERAVVVLAHRVKLNPVYLAKKEGVSAADVIRSVLDQVEPPL